MKNIIRKSFILSSFLVIVLFYCMFLTVNAAGKKTNENYWIVGVTKEMDSREENMRVIYNGFNLYIRGYASKSASLSQLQPKYKRNMHIKIASSCKIYFDDGSYESIKKYFKRNGNKGKITGYIEIRVQNGKVTEIHYGS